jgi:hypothetical protein
MKSSYRLIDEFYHEPSRNSIEGYELMSMVYGLNTITKERSSVVGSTKRKTEPQQVAEKPGEDAIDLIPSIPGRTSARY